MKEENKMKEIMNVEPAGTMPMAGAMQHMQANPNITPMQPGSAAVSPAMAQMPVKPNPMGVSPAMMNPMPVQPNPMGASPMMMNPMPLMCCPFLMNMQCPMAYGPNVMGMGMMNPMLPGTNPAMGNISPSFGNMAPGMNAMPAGVLPAMNQYFPMSGM